MLHRLRSLPFLILPLGLLASGPAARPAAQSDPGWDYPASRRGGDVDVYHGVEVPDPYRWLEDLRGDEVVAWARRQDECTTRAVEVMGGRDAIHARLEAVSDLPGYGTPSFARGAGVLHAS